MKTTKYTQWECHLKEVEMDNTAYNALVASIEKWEENARADYSYQVSLGILSCPLCMEYYRGRCHGCPIEAVTGTLGCRCTPYDKVKPAVRRWEIDELNETGDPSAKKEAILAVKAEVDFLKSLLPKTPST